MGREPHDFDLATAATPEQVMEVFPTEYRVNTGIKHGTVLVVIDDEPIEITTFRREQGFSDGRHPNEAIFITNLEEDLARRDFTINAIAFDPGANKLIDPFGGQDHIKQKVIQSVGIADNRFREDGLRILRAARFSAQLCFLIEGNTFIAMNVNQNMLDNISAERIHDELVKLLQSEHPRLGLMDLEESTVLGKILPEFVLMIGMRQNKYHKHDVWQHTLDVVHFAPRHLRIAAFFHDIGKIVTQAPKKDCPGEFTFYGHDDRGAELTRVIMNRLKFSGDEISHTVCMVENHMILKNSKNIKEAGIRRAIARIGKDRIEDLFALSVADIHGMGDDEKMKKCLLDEAELHIRFNTEMNRTVVVQSPRDLAISGKELIVHLEMKPGPAIGEMIKFLVDTVLEDPEKNTRETLLQIAKEKLWST
jgi:putative nucleotidyltransferase with HDIG domain